MKYLFLFQQCIYNNFQTVNNISFFSELVNANDNIYNKFMFLYYKLI